jgi:hypothetical protein
LWTKPCHSFQQLQPCIFNSQALTKLRPRRCSVDTKFAKTTPTSRHCLYTVSTCCFYVETPSWLQPRANESLNRCQPIGSSARVQIHDLQIQADICDNERAAQSSPVFHSAISTPVTTDWCVLAAAASERHGAQP